MALYLNNRLKQRFEAQNSGSKLLKMLAQTTYKLPLLWALKDRSDGFDTLNLILRVLNFWTGGLCLHADIRAVLRGQSSSSIRPKLIPIWGLSVLNPSACQDGLSPRKTGLTSQTELFRVLESYVTYLLSLLHYNGRQKNDFEGSVMGRMCTNHRDLARSIATNHKEYQSRLKH